MDLVKTATADVIFSDEWVREYEAEIGKLSVLIGSKPRATAYANYLLDNFYRGRKEAREFCDLYAQKPSFRKATPYLILLAHGATIDGIENNDGTVEYGHDWYFEDGGVGESVQCWIDEDWDGRYGTIVLGCCNDNPYTPTSQKSLLWVPDRKVYPSGIGDNEFQFDLIRPKKGVMSPEDIEDELAKLKKSLAKQQKRTA